MSTGSGETKIFETLVTSNKEFQKTGLKKKIQYQMSLSRSRHPDFIVAHPNEVEGKNPDWKKEIIKRCNHENELRLKVLDLRLKKKTGSRRLA